MSAAADAFVRMSDTVGFASPSRRRSTSWARTAFARVMSADIEIWNTGACQASVMRRAIVLRIDVSSTTSTSPAANAGAGAAGAGCASARSTSSATIRPSGPVPRTCARSIPRSRAIRRASGEALIRPSARAVGAERAAPRPPAPRRPGPASRSGSRAGASAGRSAPAGSASAGPAPLPEESGTASPSWPMNATVTPTGTSPSCTAIFSRTPSASASTSCVTFSVSTS